jgi:GNAT superfamily N-acetyltransferase
MQYPSGYDISIYKNYSPYFIAYYVDNKIAGVNSAHCSSPTHFRSRGLYVFEEYRNKGIAVKLLEFTIGLGKEQGCKYCWSVPRKTALKSYVAAGFEQTTNFFKTDTSDDNCYAIITV